MRRLFYTLILALLLPCFPETGNAAGTTVRLKDLGAFRGIRSNPLTGYGLVIGLAGTGDSRQAKQTLQSLSATLMRHGIRISIKDIRSRNVAAVMVTTDLPPFARSGQKIDAHVASIGDARSLAGGVLLITELVGANDEVYALGQGPVVVGGFSETQAGSLTKKNTPTSGTVPGGVVVERPAPTALPQGENIFFDLSEPDFTTATRAAVSINSAAGKDVAEAYDAGSLIMKVPSESRSETVRFLAIVEGVNVKTDMRARVIISERTGTIVAGGDVRISPVIVAHGGLLVEIREEPLVSQPLPFSQGETTVVRRAEIEAKEGKGKLIPLGGETTIADLAISLNQLGATPRDLVALLEALERAGALHAELVVQ